MHNYEENEIIHFFYKSKELFDASGSFEVLKFH